MRQDSPPLGGICFICGEEELPPFQGQGSMNAES